MWITHAQLHSTWRYDWPLLVGNNGDIYPIHAADIYAAASHPWWISYIDQIQRHIKQMQKPNRSHTIHISTLEIDLYQSWFTTTSCPSTRTQPSLTPRTDEAKPRLEIQRKTKPTRFTREVNQAGEARDNSSIRRERDRPTPTGQSTAWYYHYTLHALTRPNTPLPSRKQAYPHSPDRTSAPYQQQTDKNMGIDALTRLLR